jgi:hypothetical protein
VNLKGMQQMLDGRIDARKDNTEALGACDYCNYGYDLERRRQRRDKIMEELGGPEKAVKKAVIGLRALDEAPDTIKATIMNSPKYKGVAGLEKLIDAALQATA